MSKCPIRMSKKYTVIFNINPKCSMAFNHSSWPFAKVELTVTYARGFNSFMADFNPIHALLKG